MKIKLTRRLKIKCARIGLILFGILEILLSLAIVTFAFWAAFISDQHQFNNSSKFTGLALKSIPFAVAVIWCGIGTIQAKRWVRTFMSALSWIAFLEGSINIGTKIISEFLFKQSNILPDDISMPSGAIITVFWSGLAISFVLTTLIPLICILFYGNKYIKEVFMANSTKRPWTEDMPFAVLILCLFVAQRTLFLIFEGPISEEQLFFGMHLTKLDWTLLTGLDFLLLLYLPLGIFFQKVSAWWLTLARYIFWELSYTIGFSRDYFLIYCKNAGYSQENTNALLNERVFGLDLEQWITFLATLSFIFYVRKYFYVSKVFKKNEIKFSAIDGSTRA